MAFSQNNGLLSRSPGALPQATMTVGLRPTPSGSFAFGIYLRTPHAEAWGYKRSPLCGKKAIASSGNELEKVHPSGLEPETFGSVDRCSIQLSYGCPTSGRRLATTNAGKNVPDASAEFNGPFALPDRAAPSINKGGWMDG